MQRGQTQNEPAEGVSGPVSDPGGWARWCGGGISLFSVRVVTNVTASLLPPLPQADAIMPFERTSCIAA